MLYAYKDFLRQSVNYEYQTDLNEAKAELEGKREELRGVVVYTDVRL
jgi:hypothetical protein